MTYSSTLLKYFTNNCPKALGNYENDVPSDKDIFQTGIAAHAVLQIIGEKEISEIDEQKKRDVAKAVVDELITKGRSFAGKPEPPMNPEHAFAGRDLALDYLEYKSLPVDGKYEIGLGMTVDGKQCAYDAKECRYRAITDAIYPDVDGDIDDFQAKVITVRDYKSAWPTNADELETLQRKGQAVLTLLHYGHDIEIKGIKLEVVNLRTHQSFTKTVWFDDEGEQLLRQWQSDILQLCDAADKTRQARPGGGCLGCAWCLSCSDSHKLAMGDNVDALGLITLEARRKVLLKALKAEITEGHVEVEGGYVGYQAMSEMTLKENAIYNVLLDFYNRAGHGVKLEDIHNKYPLEVGLLESAKLGSGNVNAIAKALYDKTEMDARENLTERCLEDTGKTQFGVWKS